MDEWMSHYMGFEPCIRQNMGHNWGTSRGDSVIANRRQNKGLWCSVSADAKIPIVPVEFSPPPDVVNRSPLQTEEVPRLVKGERRARTKRTATARDEYPGAQQADRLGPQDDSQVCAGGGVGTGVWPTVSTTEQTRCVQAVFGRAAARRGVERASVAARIARA